MAVDDPLHNCQADPRPLELSVGVQALKRVEHLVGMAHVEARTIILDEYGPAMGGDLGADGYQGIVALGGELPGVAKQVFQRNAQQALVALNDESVFNVHGHATLRTGRHVVGKNGA